MYRYRSSCCQVALLPAPKNNWSHYSSVQFSTDTPSGNAVHHVLLSGGSGDDFDLDLQLPDGDLDGQLYKAGGFPTNGSGVSVATFDIAVSSSAQAGDYTFTLDQANYPLGTFASTHEGEALAFETLNPVVIRVAD